MPLETASIATALDVGDRYDLHGTEEEVVHCLPGPGGTYFDRDRSDAVRYPAPCYSDCPGRGTNRRRYLCRDNRAGRIFEAAMGAASVVSSRTRASPLRPPHDRRMRGPPGVFCKGVMRQAQLAHVGVR